MNDSGNYWLYNWLDNRGINSTESLKTVLSDRMVIEDLREAAELSWKAAQEGPIPGTNLLAGTGFRTNNDFNCPNLPCRRNQVDVLFRHAWHYFDSVLIPDAVGEMALRHEDWSEARLDKLVGLISQVLYVRELGAANLIRFFPPKLRDKAVLRDFVSDAAFESLQEILKDLVFEIQGSMELVGRNKLQASFRVTDPDVRSLTEVGMTFKNSTKRGPNTRTLAHRLAHYLIDDRLDWLADDLDARKRFGGTLGTTLPSHQRILASMNSPGPTEVALRLELPSLDRIPVKELVAVRSYEGEAFNCFRTALTAATQQILDSSEDASADVVRKRINAEIIEPELARLRRQLKAAEKALKRKSSISVALGFITTTCGLIAGVPPPTAAIGGVAAMTAVAGSAASKYLDEKQAVEMSDMYFLWKALEHAD